MKPLHSLLEGLDVHAVAGDAQVEVAGLAIDSRAVRPGYLFAALPGARADGLDFVEDACTRGARAVLTPHEGFARRGVTVVSAPDARRVFAWIASRFYDDPSQRLATYGVTGTNGKTTTAYMLRAILDAHGGRTGMIGTVEYVLGDRIIPAVRTTPEACDLQRMLAEMVRAGCDAAVMEVSSHAVVQRRIDATHFDVGIFTNLSREHLDYHESMEQYFQAKAAFIRMLGERGNGAHAVINADDAWGARLLRENHLRASAVAYGEGDRAAVRAVDVHCDAEGSRFQLESPWGRGPVRLRIPGQYNVSNALAALGAALAQGVPFETAAEALGAMDGVPGRLEAIPSDRPFRVFVDYAHTDDALERVLRALRDLTQGRLIVVFGCGGDRDATKRPAMGRAAAHLADHAILTSDNPRGEDPLAIIEQIREGFNGSRNYEIEPDRRAAIRRAIEWAREGDVVLIAGKGHENFQQVGARTIPFDDRDVVREML